MKSASPPSNPGSSLTLVVVAFSVILVLMTFLSGVNEDIGVLHERFARMDTENDGDVSVAEMKVHLDTCDSASMTCLRGTYPTR
tara:strand:- start:667 stop:918 length:252 start_codon:yes stop_codon:yes gene_type:complete